MPMESVFFETTPSNSLLDKVLMMKRRSEEKRNSSPDLEFVDIVLKTRLMGVKYGKYRQKKKHGFPTGPTFQRTPKKPKPEYLIARSQFTYIGVRW